VILALSWSGETAELKNITDFSRRYHIGLIAMTANADSTLAKPPTSCWRCAGERSLSAQSGADTSALMQLALGDALADCAVGKPRFHRDRFRRTCIPAANSARCS